MYYVSTEREKLVEYLPKGAVAAEIGVAQGDFASVLLGKAAPQQLHLIDPWSHNEGDDRGELLAKIAPQGSGQTPAPPPNAPGEKMFGAVQERFREGNEKAILSIYPFLSLFIPAARSSQARRQHAARGMSRNVQKC